jgi:Leucine-rich repeat (LRR) protein
MKQFIAQLFILLATLIFVGCEQSGHTDLTTDYGYVQFKLVKKATLDATRTTTPLDYLGDATKIEVVVQHNGATITQTLPLMSFDAESAEVGLYSEKLRLLAGEYSFIGFRLYDNLDKELYSGNLSDRFTVVADGFTQHTVGVECIERGMVSFVLQKELDTRVEGNYPFKSIRSVDISLKDKFTGVTTTLRGLEVEHREEYTDGAIDEEYYDRNGLTSYAVTLGAERIEAGNYIVTAYSTYASKNSSSLLEHCSTEERGIEFTIKDNLATEVVIPIRLSTAAEHIKDYYALREIWLAMDGPNWSYHGEAYTSGANWDFNKDVDMWGDQPGVTLDGDGRIANLNISGFGARGIVPDAIGQFTELRILYLGDHNEMIGGFDAAAPSARISAMDYHDRVLKRDARESLTKELREVINSDPEKEPITCREPRIQKLDMAFGEVTNDIQGISRAIMRLTKLEQFFIANSPITSDGFFRDVEPSSEFYAERDEWSWSKFELLTDVEIYNCAKLERLPMEMLGELPNMQSLNISLNQGITGEQLLEDWKALIDSPAGATIQILYMGYNNLEATPEHDYLKRMVKLGLLDCTNNRLREVHPFGKEISLVNVYYDYNQIERIYPAEDGYYCGLGQIETFSARNNRLTSLPDIFTARSVYVMGSINFSNNNISSLDNGDEWHGINAETLNLSNNRFETMPKAIFNSGSSISVLMMGGNGMRNIEEGAFSGSRVANLSTIDLSYNRLSDLPDVDFGKGNLPYLYGIDISCNAFSIFPREVLDIGTLTVISIRQQRDDEGNRILSDWPTGIGNHPKMAAFYIGSNDLREINDTISPYILLFEIKDNPNISIDVSNVCPYIMKGYYELVYDSTQDIRGCDALNLD